MNKPITDIGIDLDGVLYPFSNAFKKYCMERTGKTHFPEPTHWNFFEDWGLDSETFQAWLREAAETHSVFSSEAPYNGVVEAWKDLIDLDVRIHILTARPHSAWIQTIEWLDKYQLHCDTLHFTNTKGFLAKVATGRAIMLDDHVAYYEEAERAGVIPCLMSQNWNTHYTKGANRVSNLPEFVSFVRGCNTLYVPATTKVAKTSQFDDFTKGIDPTIYIKKKVVEFPHENPPDERIIRWINRGL